MPRILDTRAWGDVDLAGRKRPVQFGWGSLNDFNPLRGRFQQGCMDWNTIAVIDMTETQHG